MPIRGEASAKLANGKSLTFAVNFATLARTAASVGIVADQLLKVIGDRTDPRQMLAVMGFMEQALHRHHPGIDEDQLGSLMLNEADANALTNAFNVAVAGAFGGDDAEDKDDKNPPKPGTSTRSNRGGRKRA